jgi:hypothetical protein
MIPGRQGYPAEFTKLYTDTPSYPQSVDKYLTENQMQNGEKWRKVEVGGWNY